MTEDHGAANNPGGAMNIKTLLSSACVLALTGCGADSASTAPVVTSPAPTQTSAPTTPTPPPTTAPTATAQTFIQAGLTAGGTGNLLTPQNATAFSVTIADPDTPAARAYGDINFDGDEAITIQHSGPTMPYNESFGPDSYRGSGGNYFYTGSSAERFVPTRVYQNRVGQASSASLILPQLEESRKTAGSSAATGNLTDSVRLLDVRVGSTTSRALQLVGAPTAAGNLPVSGIRTFVGESYGARFFSDTNLQDYIGDSVLTVDYGRRTISGQITIDQFLGSTPTRPTLTIEIVGEVGADGALTGKITVRGVRVFETGYLTGALYGPTADELGFVIFSSGESGSVLGGLVAGQE
jgi:hypothetical protein